MLYIYDFLMNFVFAYSFIFSFKKLGNYINIKIGTEIITIIGISFIDTILMYNANKSIRLIVYYSLLGVFIYFFYSRKKCDFFIVYISVFYIYWLGDNLLGYAFYHYNKLNLNNILNEIVLEISVILTAFFIVYILKKIKLMEFGNIMIDSENILWIYNISIIIIFVTMMYYYDINNNINQYIIVFGLIFFTYILISYVIFYILNKLKIEKNQKKQIELYSNTIEESLENLKEFKHDCKNILISMEGFIQGNDYEGLKMYFYENLINNKHISSNNIYELRNIKNTAVKGLINNKCSRAILLGLNLNLNIINYIDDFILKDIDICKILGILIDNAIESSLESKSKIINIGICNDDDEVYIIVSNSFKSEPKIHEMFKNGYSTKGESRGLGLNIIRRLNDRKYNNIQMNTFIKDELFNQEVSILKNRELNF